MSTILYSFIAQNDSVIADYATPQIYNSDKSVNLDLIARNNLSRIPKNNSNGFNVILGHYFFHHVKNGLVLSCVTSSDENTDLPKKFLAELDSKINSNVFNNTSNRSRTLTKMMSKLVNEYNNTNMKLKSIESSLIYTTDALRENITNIMERGELIDSIVTKSGNLKAETKLFRDSVKYSNSSFITKFIINNIKNKRLYIILTVSSKNVYNNS
ncbi:synaptobrevin, putative [Theileria annulata]|uniref:Synaptobrevin, putative n=1 Tax=Theileria annulata TaxID=5874 RepID=Q4UCT2_THEAN|nr:synaptobrevin, putative [Theileria annulata]CAI75369.1 synaptobrevin, putative [Theileria annulata]|eukprot:XP_954845.1 synaptobrevin, putative [Theileria annulata]